MGAMFNFISDVNVRIVFIIALCLYAGYDFKEGIRRDAEIVELKIELTKLTTKQEDGDKSNGYEDLF